jgi:hypothetical protein
MQSLKILLLFTTFSLVASSCREEVVPEPYTYSQRLTGKTKKTWRAVSYQALKEGGETFDFSLSFCRRDDRYVYYAGTERKFEYVNGAVPCGNEPNGAVLLEDTWEVINNAATVQTFFPPLLGGGKAAFIINKLTKTEMVLDLFANEENTIRFRVFYESVSEE